MIKFSLCKMINKKAWKEGRRGEERRKKFLKEGEQFECLEAGEIFECLVGGPFPFPPSPHFFLSPLFNYVEEGVGLECEAERCS